jgi:hypothetical protein
MELSFIFYFRILDLSEYSENRIQGEISDSDLSGWFQSFFFACFSRAPRTNQNGEDYEEEDEISDDEEEVDEITDIDEDECDEAENDENMSVFLLNQLPFACPENTQTTFSSASSFTDIGSTTGIRRRVVVHGDK